MTALFWWVVALTSAWGYLTVGRRLALTIARSVYKHSDDEFCERCPTLAYDKPYRHRRANDDAAMAFWPSMFFWPLALLVVAVRRKVGVGDFSPDNERLQQRIKELETELGMQR